MPVPPPPPPVAVEVDVVCEGCPEAPLHLLAYPAVDRYAWPWWDAYGVLAPVHGERGLDAIRPAPVAALRLAGPGTVRLELPAGEPAYLFALLDVDGGGPDRGAGPRDWIGRFPRNPVPVVAGEPAAAIVLEPMSWGPDFPAARYAVPPAPAAVASGAVRFRDATAEAGIAFRHCQGGDPGQLPVVTGAGAALEDLDGDGDLDLYAVQGLGDCRGASRTSTLWLNDGRGRFADATARSGAAALASTGMGVAAADFDADGDLDLYVTSLQGGRLLRNDGAARFADATRAAGIEPAADGWWPAGATFGDVDGDGRLDLYVTSYVRFSTAPPFAPDAEVPAFAPAMLSSPFAFPPEPNRLWLNRGGGRFVEAPGALGAADPEGKGMAAALVDLDGDLDLDLYVTNDCTRDRLFENRAGRFADVSRAARVDDVSSGMGIAAGDVDGDGRPDLVSPHWLNEPVVAYRNASQASALRFEEATADWGLARAGRGLTGWSAELFDADRDGDLDLLVTNGHTHPGRVPGVLEPQPLQLWLNDGTGCFEDASAALAAAVPDLQVWRGAALGDVDGDGDVDLYLVAWNGQGRLVLNESPARPGVTLRLVRASGERGAVGARVEVDAGGRRLVRWVASGTGYLSHGSLEVELGLGDLGPIEALRVAWPNGRVEAFPPPRPDERVATLVEGTGAGPGR